MGGDLNLKKSWHPHLKKNQERVWKEEKNALEERKQIEKLRKEREEERALEELQALQEANGGKVAQKRIDWMYSGPGGDSNGVTEEREGYLLGKRRIDNLLKSNDTQSLQKGAAVGIDAIAGSNINLARDTHKKVLDDPLLLIQKSKMEAQLKAMKDLQKQAKYDEKRAKEKDRERRHRHRHHSRRDRSRSRSADYDDRDRRERKHRRHDRDERDDRDHYRRRSRSRSPYRKSHRDDNRRRSRSPRRREDREDWGDYRRRDRSPPRRSYESRRRDSDEDRPRRPRSPASAAREEPKESAADRLAKMQADASSLEDQRSERVRLREAEDAAEEEKHKKNMDGGRRLISSMRGKAADMDLGDVIARGRQGFRKEVDV